MDSVYNPIQNQMEIAQLYNRSSRFSGTQSFCDKTTADVFECAINIWEISGSLYADFSYILLYTGCLSGIDEIRDGRVRQPKKTEY